MIDFKDFNKNIVPEKGDLLISEPFLPDPNFQRTVVLICEHGEGGSFGFVLNKPSILKGSDVLEDADNFQAVLHVGGPVQQDTLHFIHREPGKLEGGLDMGNDLYWGGNFEELLLLMEAGAIEMENFKFFVGYSGWGKGQLEEELAQNAWIVYKAATAEDVFDTQPDTLWRECLKRMGGKYKVISNYPTDPRLN
jgi:putative transcriptional regulator